MSDLTPADELRAAAAVLRKLAVAARAKTMTGNGNEWLPWSSVREYITSPGFPSEPTGDASVAHPRFAHNHEEAWEETAFITGVIPAPIAEWMALVHPGLAEPLAFWLDSVAWNHLRLCAASDQVLGEQPVDPKHAEAVQILKRGPYDLQQALAVARVIVARVLLGGDRD